MFCICQVFYSIPITVMAMIFTYEFKISMKIVHLNSDLHYVLFFLRWLMLILNWESRKIRFIFSKCPTEPSSPFFWILGAPCAQSSRSKPYRIFPSTVHRWRCLRYACRVFNVTCLPLPFISPEFLSLA
jgi:hypothetical protein